MLAIAIALFIIIFIWKRLGPEMDLITGKFVLRFEKKRESRLYTHAPLDHRSTNFKKTVVFPCFFWSAKFIPKSQNLENQVRE